MARIASAKVASSAAVQADAPVFVRQPSSGVKIQIPLLNLQAQEAPAPILIDTGIDVMNADD